MVRQWGVALGRNHIKVEAEEGDPRQKVMKEGRPVNLDEGHDPQLLREAGELLQVAHHLPRQLWDLAEGSEREDESDEEENQNSEHNPA